MKAAWIRPGGGRIPDGPKAKRYGIDTLVWSTHDPALDGKLMEEIRGFGFKVGIMRDPSWDVSHSAFNSMTDAQRAAWAKKFTGLVSEDLNRLGMNNRQCQVILDIEHHNAQFIIDVLREWRALRPTRVTYWTPEPDQGGWFSPELVRAINMDPNLVVLPQCYYGPAEWNGHKDMTPAVESLVAMNVQAAGVRWERIRMFYGPANLPKAWDGIVFGLADLP